ncbi:hypothetical protein [Sulfurisphaera ohwakuensis]|uniref:Uncharacterized protein (UPF0297 family) n=1 Tax=Sulfurisphaera ohwakuensis TaxID=69656 RepID=A0A650CJ29_SULOH|nr:hypothetical protein [Sulfurisphaera ohwakuensis]MBB5253490.1 uncharacterized protein (UPF0297 family) [Sulfurisphaera ohwakuensis]QGR17796.1 hypothetical protein D1869_11870 [Sulfurisphaera ohwakuensis]
MDYIKVAENLGFSKDLIVNIYKKISGGYYISLYYAKSPILYALDQWPKKYLGKKFLLWYNSSFDSEIDKIISLFVTLDVKILHRVASILIKQENQDRKEEDDINDVFEEMKKTAEKYGFTYYPQRIEIVVKNSLINELVNDIFHIREREIKNDLYTILGEIAYESEYLTKIKEEKNWIRAIDRKNILKALYLEGKLEEFLSQEKIKIRYLIASRTLIFDKLLLTKGIKETLNDIKDLKNEELKNEVEKLTTEINKRVSYF